MRISDVLRKKGTGVVTIQPHEPVTRLLDMLAENSIGACVVSADGKSVAGIVSERDVVRQLQASGAGILDGPVSAIMTSEVITCEPQDEVESLEQTMTNSRIRHVPVTKSGQLYALVSIGDVVKQRIDSLQTERDHLVGYIAR